MATAREDVAALMGLNKNQSVIEPVKPSTPVENKPVTEVKFKQGDKVKLLPGAKYTSGKSIPGWVFEKPLYAREIRSNGTCVISTVAVGAVTGVVYSQDLMPYDAVSSNFKPYIVRVTTDVLNVRANAGTSYPITTQVKLNQLYTIVEEKGKWGKLKSGAGWIHLDYTKKV
jgi:hypothetical protein